MTDVKQMGFNRRAVRVIYNNVDWDQYDRGVAAESLPAYEEAVEALDALVDAVFRLLSTGVEEHGLSEATNAGVVALRRLRGSE